MNTLPLFNLARKTDPQTSHEAAAHIRRKATAVQRAFLAALLDEPQTAIEAAMTAARTHGGLVETYRKRGHEVVRMGFAEIRSTRVCRITGQRASVFEITDAGRKEIGK